MGAAHADMRKAGDPSILGLSNHLLHVGKTSRRGRGKLTKAGFATAYLHPWTLTYDERAKQRECHKAVHSASRIREHSLDGMRSRRKPERLAGRASG